MSCTSHCPWSVTSCLRISPRAEQHEGLIRRKTAESALDTQGARKIDFGAFERALPLLAEQKGVSAEEVRRCIVLSEGPRRNSSVTPDFVRLHDDKTTFTGASPLLDMTRCTKSLSKLAALCLCFRPRLRAFSGAAVVPR